MRCGWHLSQRGARTYEASFVRSNTMPKSPFANPSPSKPKPTAGVPFSAHAFNSEAFDAGAEPQQQGTQIDAIGHFAVDPAPWDPKDPFSAEGATYYGGFKQQDVKPSADSPLLKLGIEKIPPLVTTAVLLDARRLSARAARWPKASWSRPPTSRPCCNARASRSAASCPATWCGSTPAGATTGRTRDDGGPYYAMAPGLSVDAAKWLATKRIVAIGLDAPFIDAVPNGMLQGKAPPAPGTEPGLPFSIHHYMLSVFGIHHLENLNLAAMAARPRLDLVRDGAAVARQGSRGRGRSTGCRRPSRPALKEISHV